MELYVSVMVFVFGLLIGSFLNVVLYRMHTGKSLNGSSHCLSCNHRLKWSELVPVISYFFLRGRCSNCRAHIPSRYAVVELLTAGLFVLAWTAFDTLLLQLLAFGIVSLLVLIVLYDIRHTIIPDELTIVLTVMSLLFIAHEYFIIGDQNAWLYRISAAVGVTAFFFLLWGVSKGTWMGFGDVKLVFPLALIVGVAGAFTLVVLAFWIGAVISVCFMVLGKLTKRYSRVVPGVLRQRITLKSEVPFAPFLALSFLLVYLCKLNVFTFFTYGLL